MKLNLKENRKQKQMLQMIDNVMGITSIWSVLFNYHYSEVSFYQLILSVIFNWIN